MIQRYLTVYCMSSTPFLEDGPLDDDGLRANLGRVAATGNGVYLGSPEPTRARH